MTGWSMCKAGSADAASATTFDSSPATHLQGGDHAKPKKMCKTKRRGEAQKHCH